MRTIPLGVELCSSGEEKLLINDRKEDPNRAKEVKVKIPVGYHIKLHSMKVLTGKPISDAVTEALEAYFATRHFDLAHDLKGIPDGIEGLETFDGTTH
jgi:hypothetical protein